MKMNKISFITIYMLALAVILCAYFYLVYQPLGDRVAELDAQRNEYETEYALLVENLDKKDDLKESITNRKAQIEEMTAKLGNTTALNIADEVYRAMKNVGLNEEHVRSVTVGDVENKEKRLSDGRTLLSVSISLSIDAEYDVVQKFLQQFESNDNSAFFVPNIVMSAKEGDESYQVSLTYYYADKVSTPENGTENSGEQEITDEDVEALK